MSGVGETIRRASVQYGDARGSISIDTFGGAEGMDLSQLAHECGVPGWPVGFSLYFSQDKREAETENGHTFEYATFYVVIGAYPAKMKEICAGLEDGEPLPVEAFNVRLPKNYKRYFKRLSIVIRERALVEIDENMPLKVVRAHDLRDK